MNKPIWNTFSGDPRNMMGESIITGRESLYRNRAIECARVGNDCVSHVTITRYIVPVRLS
jgi:hypothetical protein